MRKRGEVASALPARSFQPAGAFRSAAGGQAANATDSVNDALDQLLFETRASIDYLDQLRAQVPEEELKKARRRARTEGAANFWKPRVVGVWNLEDMLDELGCDLGSDSEDDSTEDEMDEDDRRLWDMLHGPGRALPYRRSIPTTRPTSIARDGYKSGSTTPGSAASSAAAGTGPTRFSSGARASAEANGSNGRFAAGYAGPSRGRPEGKKPMTPPKQQNAGDSNARRGNAGGFRFGNFGNSAASSSVPVPAAVEGRTNLEAEITAPLLAAKASGQAAVRKTLRRLLLRWHPDKAPQGDTPEEEAQRAESTRVMRFVLQERERLGL
eukprot:TRINITY_DN42863_c0_g1_i1.p1 TRINITY_DN42863_c0_g1~~TRINITY_DN42863_c0_g1_i1.p1  ORF type:complete len:375 (+),score=61.19 TRINITY_DN42863_c0_g1_i1:149-1126(+)